MGITSWFVIFLSFSSNASALRALGLLPIGAYGHNMMFRSMFEALVEHGHSVVMVSPFPRKTPMANYTDLDVSAAVPKLVNRFEYDSSVAFWWPGFEVARLTRGVKGADWCRRVFSTPEFKDVMAGKYGKFDAVFTEALGSDCFTAVAYKMQVPLISILTLSDSPYMHDRVGSIYNPSYMPCVGEDLDMKMNFWQRAFNTFSNFVLQTLHKWEINNPSEEVVREFLGDGLPPLDEIVRNTSLILVNRHLSSEAAVPTPPNVVHVGGLHVKSLWRNGKPRFDDMSPELKAWLDEADELGVILFTFGSTVPLSSYPRVDQIHVFEHLGRLPHRIVVKYEKEPPIKIQNNIRLEGWIPQGQVLAHPKVVLFVTHCGLMGTQESIAAGVPVLCVPIFGDQMFNANLYVFRGIGQRINPQQMRHVNLTDRILQMTAGGEYLARAREMAARYRDRPRTVEEEAVWWVEYVVRHRGAPHLRPLGADLPLYQYLLLDVAAAGLLLLLLLLLPAALLARRLLAAGRSVLLAGQSSQAKKRQ